MCRAILTIILCLPNWSDPPAPRPAPDASPASQPSLPEIAWDEAARHIGERCVVSGKIVAARSVRSRCFLNFHEDFRRHLTVTIPRESFDKFSAPPEKLFANQNVRVVGQIVEFQGRPEIVVTAPDQISVVEPAAAPRPAQQSQPASPAEPPPASQPAALATGLIKVATLNTLNLFDAYDDPYTTDESTPAKPPAELQHLADTIRALNADVLALEEVENRGCLERFVKSFLPDVRYEHIVLFEGNDERGIDVALLSRFPVGPVTSYRHRKFARPDGSIGSFQRDLLRVRIEPPALERFDVFVVHLKSKRGAAEGADPTLNIRMGEASAIRAILDELLAAEPAARFLICGDFNDRLDSQPLRTIIARGDRALRTWVDDLPESERLSYNAEPHRSLIDFILTSPALAARYQPGSYHIAPGTVETNGTDHNPVSAVFDLRGAEKTAGPP